MEQATGEDVTRMAQEVGATLRRVLAESPQVAHCLSRIRAEGYDVSVVLEATIGFSRTESANDAARRPAFDVRVEKAEPAAAQDDAARQEVPALAQDHGRRGRRLSDDWRCARLKRRCASPHLRSFTRVLASLRLSG